MKSSRITISRFTSPAEYSANNSYNYNGNNGNLNNNNKYNTLGVRGVLELLRLQPDLESLPFPLSEFYDTYRVTRRNKACKPSHMCFRQHYQTELMKLCYEVNSQTYNPITSIAFIITKPKPREVIAADFRDRVVQTLFVENLLYYLEKYEHPHSYSCRIGKGSLAAVKRFEELNEKYRGGYVCFLDLANHFMSINTDFWTSKIVKFINRYYDVTQERKELLTFLADKIYNHKPQNDCIRKSSLNAWNLIPAKKSLFHSETGLPIGNVTSQMLSNFLTTPYLRRVEKEGFEFGFYTDDMGIFTFNKDELLRFIPKLRKFLKDKYGLTLHPNKIYIQHISKGFNALGFRIKRNNITPSKRIVNNFYHTIDSFSQKGFKEIETISSKVNSYLGLLSWSHSYNVRKEGILRLQKAGWNKFLRFMPNFLKIEIRPQYTKEFYYKKYNQQRKRESLKLQML